MKTTTMMLGLLLLATTISFAQDDQKGCKDHPLFTRMPNFYLYDCSEREFDQKKFQNYVIEGHVYEITYMLKNDAKAPGALAVLRNYIKAAKSVGGEIKYETNREALIKFTKDGKEIWANLYSSLDREYRLTIVEKAELEQVVEANPATAESWKKDIEQTGKVALYGIYFDTGKSDIKKESEPALKEIAKLVSINPTMKLYVVGHTDNVGELEYNLKLSKARADAVMNELVNKYKISSARLKAHGTGPTSPVASNSTDEGKAKNRRVELVEQ